MIHMVNSSAESKFWDAHQLWNHPEDQRGDEQFWIHDCPDTSRTVPSQHYPKVTQLAVMKETRLQEHLALGLVIDSILVTWCFVGIGSSGIFFYYYLSIVIIYLSLFTKGTEFRLEQHPRFELHAFSIFALWLSASYLASLSLVFLISKIRIRPAFQGSL